MSPSKKKAFVIMPIKAIGSPEYKHYRALFDGVIAPAITEFGYEVKRADDFQTSGSITKDIILPLATADLVVADLTNLNPNVFYELGVRHTLVRRGTIMIMDESQTDLPFDVHAYRVIKFRGDIPGINELRAELSSYVQQLGKDEFSGRDNLVHDWIPSLPANVYSFVATGRDDDQTKVVERLQSQLSEYVDRYGKIPDSQPIKNSRLLIKTALEEARSGNLPNKIVDQAEKCAGAQDVLGFLELVDKVLNLRSLVPTKSHFLRLRSAAQDLEIQAVEVAIIDQAIVLFPDDQDLMTRRLATYAHSDETALLLESISGFKIYLGITSDEPAEFARPLRESDLSFFGIMLDAYHRMRMHEKAINLCRKANELTPGRALILRNLGRALERAGNPDESLEFFRQSANAADSDDQGPSWLASQLYNRNRLVDACEAYSLACIRDPDDGNYFARLARTIVSVLRGIDSGSGSTTRQLPASLASMEIVTRAISAALGCQVTQAIAQTLRAATQQGELALEDLMSEEKNTHRSAMKSSRARLDFAREVYLVMASPLTSSASVGSPRVAG